MHKIGDCTPLRTGLRLPDQVAHVTRQSQWWGASRKFVSSGAGLWLREGYWVPCNRLLGAVWDDCAMLLGTASGPRSELLCGRGWYIGPIEHERRRRSPIEPRKGDGAPRGRPEGRAALSKMVESWRGLT